MAGLFRIFFGLILTKQGKILLIGKYMRPKERRCNKPYFLGAKLKKNKSTIIKRYTLPP